MRTYVITAALAAALMAFDIGTAQAQTPSVETNKPFTIAFTHDTANTVGYQVFIDTVMVRDVPTSVVVAGTGTVAGLTVAQRGAHSVYVRAYNEDQFADSDALAFVGSKPKPNKPGKPSITSGLIAVLRSPVTGVEKLVALFRKNPPSSDFTVRIITG
jgi:hypothetical protein